MSVVPLKQYNYPAWVEIAAKNNDLRTERAFSLWSEEDIRELWWALFG